MISIDAHGLWFEASDWSFSSYNASPSEGWDFGGFSFGFLVPGRGHYRFGYDPEYGWEFEHLEQQYLDFLQALADDAREHPERLIPFSIEEFEADLATLEQLMADGWDDLEEDA